ncbi:MAG TPA: zinc transporter ZupT [Planctomycetota bacterium]|nr:zinc transporter ZupT [Planctomycetota bacterium]
MQGDLGLAFLLTAGAGLATTVGSLLGIVVRKPTPRLLGVMLGFSAGVMILVSFVELLQKGIESLSRANAQFGFMQANLAFAAGILFFVLIDWFVPHDYEGDHDHPHTLKDSRLERTGMLTALGIGLHNFPEGVITFVGTLYSVDLGKLLAVAIALHNIPEGLAVSAPIYAATGSRKKAFFWSFLSGVTEPVGAVLAALILMPLGLLTDASMGWVLAAVAGIMVAISLDELIPAAKKLDDSNLPLLGVTAGMLVMALSLWMLH